MSGQIMWGKFAVWSTITDMAAVMASGWGIMTWSTPTEQQFYDALSPELKRKMDDVRAQRAGKNEIRDKLELTCRAPVHQTRWCGQTNSPRQRQIPGIGNV
ncbi:uncharacterized protein MKK02DRAFT_28100 [Dioszegia hungarica]|uniref:Uncharacterized protein n=1 Tax=Dioszegia hungarica TaxID=4972 RepID=A0AA38LVA1_9TREE|nr:uncharacterized protein MKK02DRAFT_28100 [Dioszegia hungarica]KAI9634996.1 hypothetical protein MKK02DRAFT_28100 [Dioszegia hungarica]